MEKADEDTLTLHAAWPSRGQGELGPARAAIDSALRRVRDLGGDRGGARSPTSPLLSDEEREAAGVEAALLASSAREDSIELLLRRVAAIERKVARRKKRARARRQRGGGGGGGSEQDRRFERDLGLAETAVQELAARVAHLARLSPAKLHAKHHRDVLDVWPVTKRAKSCCRATGISEEGRIPPLHTAIA